MKNGRPSLFSFWDTNAQTFGRSENRPKIGLVLESLLLDESEWIFSKKYLKKVPVKNFWDFWLKQPSRGWRTRIWPKTGTGSSFCRHFGENEFLGFSRGVSAHYYGPRRSIFGPVSSLMELNMRAKVQGHSSNVTHLPHERLSAWRPIQNSFFCWIKLGRWTDRAALWPTYGGA